MPCVTFQGCHVASHGHVMCHLTPGVSKNVTFLLSRNLTKFDEVTRFHETNSMVMSISSSEIKKIFGFQPKLPFYLFSEKLNFSRVLQIICDIYDHLLLSLHFHVFPYTINYFLQTELPFRQIFWVNGV